VFGWMLYCVSAELPHRTIPPFACGQSSIKPALLGHRADQEEPFDHRTALPGPPVHCAET
jgi:hypothetical protein